MLLPEVHLLRGTGHLLLEPAIELPLAEKVDLHAIELVGEGAGVALSQLVEGDAATDYRVDTDARVLEHHPMVAFKKTVFFLPSTLFCKRDALLCFFIPDHGQGVGTRLKETVSLSNPLLLISLIDIGHSFHKLWGETDTVSMNTLVMVSIRHPADIFEVHPSVSCIFALLLE